MALDAGKAGTVYPSYAYEVSREKIREYAAAIGETDPRYFSDGDDAVAPATFAACFTLGREAWALLDDPTLGAHARLIHSGQRYVYGGRPLRPGDRLEVTPRIVDITTRGANEMLVLELDARFADSGEPAVRSETTLVFLGSASSDGSAGAEEAGDGGDAP